MATHSWIADDDIVVCHRYLTHRREPAPTSETPWVRSAARLIDTTPASIVKRFQNFAFVATGRGLDRPAELTEATWTEWGHRPDDLAAEAAAGELRLEQRRRDERPPLPEMSADVQARIDARTAERRRERSDR
jgi:hypothetical protein